jgi:hypothetical protein
LRRRTNRLQLKPRIKLKPDVKTRIRLARHDCKLESSRQAALTHEAYRLLFRQRDSKSQTDLVNRVTVKVIITGQQHIL